MRKLRKQNLTKKIIYIIIFLMLCNFIIPNYSYAVSTESGGVLLEVVIGMVCFIPDMVIECLQKMFTSTSPIEHTNDYTISYSPGIIFSGKVRAFGINFISPKRNDGGKVNIYLSTEEILQPIIAKWYKALRRVATVGLLSVILYIGIRIVLSSTSAKDKAKYKKMLKEWLVALCLLFALHYIMNVTIVAVDKINEVIGVSAIGINGEDVLMTSLRNKIHKEINSWGDAATYVIIYCVLAVYTVIFTIQYIKRTIYIAFLTVIAPLVTLTYPLDKIKDGKAQAFDMWLKDYVFFVLIQVVHLLLYYILLSSSMNLAHPGNWIYAIVAIGFLTKAEKIIKKMFGFEKSSSMGAMAAGATGAFVTNAMNKITHSGGSKSSGGGASSSSGTNTRLVRTSTTAPIQGIMPGLGTSNPYAQSEGSENGGAGGNSSPINNGIPTPGMHVNGKNNTSTTSKPNTVGTNSKKSPNKKSSTGSNNNKQLSKQTSRRGNRPKPHVLRGATTLLGRFIGASAKGTIKVLLGGTGAIIGFSAGAAQGEMGQAFTGLVGGAKAGSYLASNTVETAKKLKEEIPEKAHEFADTYREGAYGEEYANKEKSDREFRKSSDYKKLKENNTNFSDKKVQQMLDEGITDAKQMDKILKNNKKHPRKYSMADSIKYSQMAAKCKTNVLYNKKSFIRFCQNQKVTDLSDENLEKLRKCIIDFK